MVCCSVYMYGNPSPFNSQMITLVTLTLIFQSLKRLEPLKQPPATEVNQDQGGTVMDIASPLDLLNMQFIAMSMRILICWGLTPSFFPLQQQPRQRRPLLFL